MSERIVSVNERNLTTVVDNIEHVESQSLHGIAVVKVYLQPNASLDRAIAQITSSSQTQLNSHTMAKNALFVEAAFHESAPLRRTRRLKQRSDLHLIT